MAFNTIDLDRAEQAVSSLITNEQRQGYQPKTLQSRTNARYAYLPLFPTKSFGPNNCLPLANVPGSSFKIYQLINHFFSFSLPSYSYSPGTTRVCSTSTWSLYFGCTNDDEQLRLSFQ
jgi:hypothetical protein